MLDRSPLASYSFTSSKGVNIRVCYQDPSGNIKQTFYDSTSGWHNGTNGVVGKADLNNGLAITGWDKGNQERVYYIGQDNKIVERCYSAGKSGWYDGDLTGKFTAAHYSNLAVMNYDNAGTWCIRVVYQSADNIIRILCRDGEKAWYPGATFPAALQGTSIACSYVAGGNYKRFVYYQKPDTTFAEYISPNFSDWSVGGFKPTVVHDPCAYIAVASYSNVSHRVFTVDRDNKLCVTEHDSGWAQTKQLTSTIVSSPLAAIVVAGSTRVRVYLQTAPFGIAEWGTNDGKTYSQMQSSLPTN